jgi:hypothetical protein
LWRARSRRGGRCALFRVPPPGRHARPIALHGAPGGACWADHARRTAVSARRPPGPACRRARARSDPARRRRGHPRSCTTGRRPCRRW